MTPSDPVPEQVGNTPAGKISAGVRRGILAGLATSWLLIKVMVPTMAAVHLLKALGVLGRMAEITAPVMGLFGLPGEASLALITGGLVNIYAAIAVAVNITMTAKSMTVLAIMVLIAHNLIVETAVQSKTGSPAWLMLVSRLSAAALAGVVFNLIIPGGDRVLTGAAVSDPSSGFLRVIAGNALSLVKIALIIVSLMTAVELMRAFGLLDRLMGLLHRPMALLGMERKTSFVAAVGLVLGLAYGAGLIIDETRRNSIDRDDILATNLFLGTNHALIEDSLIFAAVGANLIWIVAGRLVFGALFLRITLPLACRLAGKGERLDVNETISP